jgi:hypothetical protein
VFLFPVLGYRSGIVVPAALVVRCTGEGTTLALWDTTDASVVHRMGDSASIAGRNLVVGTGEDGIPFIIFCEYRYQSSIFVARPRIVRTKAAGKRGIASAAADSDSKKPRGAGEAGTSTGAGAGAGEAGSSAGAGEAGAGAGGAGASAGDAGSV